MPTLTYHLVDVFTDRPFGGNPLAVFTPENPDLTEEMMQVIANELNLSETVFVGPSEMDDASYRLRIFTPQVELPMAGHPTVGTGFVLAREGLLEVPSEIVCEEGVGAVPIALSEGDDGQIIVSMQQPLPTFGDVLGDRAAIAMLLSLSPSDLLDGCPIQFVSTGVPFLYIPVKDRDALARAEVRMDLWNAYYRESVPQVFVFTMDTESDDVDCRSRMFAPGMGIKEDPATGAASGPLGAYLMRYKLVDSGNIVSEQGFEMGRPSVVHICIEMDEDKFTGVYVSGTSVYIGPGEIHLPDHML